MVAVYKPGETIYIGKRRMGAWVSGPSDRQGIKLIIDLDQSGDVGDAAANAIAMYLMAQGIVNVKGMVVDVTNTYAPGATDAINTYYGFPGIPIGANKGSAFDPSGPGSYAQHLAQNFTNDIVTASNAVEGIALYRQLLAAAANSSIVFVAIGPLNMLSLLLASSADGYSALAGDDLVAAKASELVVMGGDWPNSVSAEFNFDQDKTAANDVVANWPTPITFFGFTPGTTVKIGNGISSNTPVANPVRKAHELTGYETNGREAWDAFPLLYAARGLSTGYDTWFSRVRGTAVVNASTGQNTWTDDAGGNHYYLVKALMNLDYQELFNQQLFFDPGESAPVRPAYVVVDNFTDTNGTSLDVHAVAPVNTPVTAWTEAVGDWTIQSNALTVAASAGGDHRAVFNPGIADGFVYVRFRSPASGTMSMGIIVNYQDASNFWLINLFRNDAGSSSSMTIFRCISGSFTSPAAEDVAWAYSTDYTVGIKVSGNTIVAQSIELGDTVTYTVADRPLKTATQCGVRIFKRTANAANTDDDGTTIDSIMVRPLA